MNNFSIAYRVIYGDTDPMDVMYYSNYLRLFEIGRAELLRHSGLTYKLIEDSGYLFPVVESHCKYIKPAVYDDLLAIIPRIDELKHASLSFDYMIIRKESGEELARGYTKHACLSKNGKITKFPEFIFEKLKEAKQFNCRYC